MTQQDDFFKQWAPAAASASQATGVPTSTILAQWADETGYGTSSAFVSGHNFAGVSPGGNVAGYADFPSGLVAYIRTLNDKLYDTVRGSDPVASAQALGRSPWAESHYGGDGADLVKIMSSYGLTQYDAVAGGPVPSDPSATSSPPSTSAGGSSSSGSGGITGLLRSTALTVVLVLGGVALVGAGVWQAVGPATKAKAGEAKKTAGTAASVGAL